MKTSRLFASITGITLSIIGLLALNGCGKSTSTSAPGVDMVANGKTSAEPTSFNNVAAHLDSGGNFYLYLSTEQWLTKLSAKVSEWRGIFDSIPGGTAEDREKISKVFDVVTRLIKDSGLEDISGFGMSSIATEKSFYHSKVMLHHYKGQGDGFLWTMFGSKPHALEGLELLPATTALAVFSDLDLEQLWKVIEGQITQIGVPELSREFGQFATEFQRGTGMDWNKTLASLGGEYGLVITLDEAKMVPVPLPNNGKLEVPSPGIMIVMKMDDETIFNRLEQELGKSGMQVMSVNEGSLKMRTVAVPNPLQFELRPSIAMADGYMFIATSDSLVREALAIKSGKSSGLKSTDEFKKLSADVPLQGNSFSYVSQRFGKTFVQIQSQFMEMKSGGNGEMDWLKKFMNPDLAAHSFGVSANTDEGWLSIGNGNQNPATMILLVPVAVTAVTAAAVLPAIAKAKASAQNVQ